MARYNKTSQKFASKALHPPPASPLLQMPEPSPPKHASKVIPLVTTPKSIWTRKFDLLYLIYFLIHIPVMFRKPLPSSLPTSFPFPIY